MILVSNSNELFVDSTKLERSFVFGESIVRLHIEIESSNSYKKPFRGLMLGPSLFVLGVRIICL